MIWTNVKLALTSLRSSKLRAFLTMMAVIIGVMGFVVVTATVEGLKSSVANEVNDLGGNLVTVNPGQIIERDDSGEVSSFNFAAAFGASTLTEKDLKSIQNIEGVNAAAPQMLVSGLVQRNGEIFKNNLIIATNQDYPASFGQEVAEGDFFTDDQEQFVIVGQDIVEELYGGKLSLGTQLRVAGEDFTVLGAMESFDSAFTGFGADLNRAVIIPLKSGKKINGGTVLIQEIDVQVASTEQVDSVVEEINSTLLENHGGEQDFTVLRQDELIDLTGGIFDQIKAAAQALSFIMLFVGGVVILLIMLITVSERTREIGIRKSIGATNSNIMIQFLTEAVVISWVGSLLGVFFAYLLGFAVKNVTDISPEYSMPTLISVAVISTVIGSVAGLYPASQAARKDPVEALRHE